MLVCGSDLVSCDPGVCCHNRPTLLSIEKITSDNNNNQSIKLQWTAPNCGAATSINISAHKILYKCHSSDRGVRNDASEIEKSMMVPGIATRRNYSVCLMVDGDFQHNECIFSVQGIVNLPEKMTSCLSETMYIRVNLSALIPNQGIWPQ